jgi:hypothetical protein
MCVMWASPVSSRVIVTTQVEWTGGVSLKGVDFFFSSVLCRSLLLSAYCFTI